MKSRLERIIRSACVIEATARKPGNVHPWARFADVEYADFVSSADAIAPILAHARTLGVGPAILEAVRATQYAAGRNTNLGIILLLAPLAAVDPLVPLTVGIQQVLVDLTMHDADLAFAAIREAAPGGLGQAAAHDVSLPPQIGLVEAMQLAAHRDLIAAQYVSGFSTVLTEGVDLLTKGWESRQGENVWRHPRPAENSSRLSSPTGLVNAASLGQHPLETWEACVICLQLSLMARHPDSLIARKLGSETAYAASDRARHVLESGWPSTGDSGSSFAGFDTWLRADGHRRNPGTTADLIAASLFALLRDGGALAADWEDFEGWSRSRA